MRRAIALSQEAIKTASGPPFGAVIVRNGEIITEGFNHVHADNDPTAHAEIVAIRAACLLVGSPFLDGCVIYSSSEPCPMCMSAIYWSRIAKVYFSTDREDAAHAGFDDQLLYAELQRPVEQRSIPMTKLLSAVGQVTFDIWQNNAHLATQTMLNENPI
jgi:guanine deaminase